MTTSGARKKTQKTTGRASKTSSQNGESFTDCVVAIIEAAGTHGIKHMSVKKGDIDIEFVMGGEVALTPASNLYHGPLTSSVENSENLSDNDTEQDLPDEPDIEELALLNPLAYEELRKEEE